MVVLQLNGLTDCSMGTGEPDAGIVRLPDSSVKEGELEHLCCPQCWLQQWHVCFNLLCDEQLCSLPAMSRSGFCM